MFASVDLTPGTIIPILAKKITQAEFDKLKKSHTAIHIWDYYQSKDNIILNGDPKLNTHGLNISMLINEPSKKMPNCIFKLNSIVVAMPIKKGEELYVYYGRAYEPVRKKMGYSLEGNKHLEAHYPDMDKIKAWPSKERRWRVIHRWLAVIEKYDKRRTGAINTYYCHSLSALIFARISIIAPKRRSYIALGVVSGKA